MNTVPRGAAGKAQADEALSRAIRSSLDLPLSALRASLESLARDLGEDPRSAGVGQALSEVSRAGRVVRDLADYASPPIPQPLPCSIDEIVYTARLRLSRAERERVSIANSIRGRRLFIDGPLLSRAIERLLRNAVEANDGQVLITARRETRTSSRILINVVNGTGCSELDPSWASAPFHTNKPDHLGLGLTLAARDIGLLGGTLSLARTPRGEIVATADLPDSQVRRPIAEL